MDVFMVLKKCFPCILLLFIIVFFYWSIDGTKRNSSNYQHKLINNSKEYFPEIIVYPDTVDKLIDLLIIVSSSPNHYKQRLAIRLTWANCKEMLHLYNNSNALPKSFICQQVFMVARTNTNDKDLLNEASMYGDLIIADYVDTYKTITKKLLSTFLWASTQSPKFILKCDDDVYIHIPRLVSQVLVNEDDYFYGGVMYSGLVMRGESHRHYVPYELFAEDRFPPFCKGAMFVFSGSLLPKLLSMARKIPVFGVDDAFVGVLMRNIGVQPKSISQFLLTGFFPLVEFISDCSFNRIIGFGHNLKSYHIYQTHQRYVMTSSTTYHWTCCIELSLMHFVSFLIILLLCKILKSYMCILRLIARR